MKPVDKHLVIPEQDYLNILEMMRSARESVFTRFALATFREAYARYKKKLVKKATQDE